MMRYLTTACLLLTFISITPSTEGAIVDTNDDTLTNYQSADGNNITTDTDTGLDWLDIDTTTGKSVSQITDLFAANMALDGFRYASLDEVLVYFTHLGLPPAVDQPEPDPEQFIYFEAQSSTGETALAPANHLLPPSARYAIGFTSTVHPSDPTLATPYYISETDPDTSLPTVRVAITYTEHPSLGSPLGSWVVREVAAVPEPASVVVWSLLGAMGLAIAGWRRRSRSHSTSSV